MPRYNMDREAEVGSGAGQRAIHDCSARKLFGAARSRIAGATRPYHPCALGCRAGPATPPLTVARGTDAVGLDRLAGRSRSEPMAGRAHSGCEVLPPAMFLDLSIADRPVRRTIFAKRVTVSMLPERGRCPAGSYCSSPATSAAPKGHMPCSFLARRTTIPRQGREGKQRGGFAAGFRYRLLLRIRDTWQRSEVDRTPGFVRVRHYYYRPTGPCHAYQAGPGSPTVWSQSIIVVLSGGPPQRHDTFQNVPALKRKAE